MAQATALYSKTELRCKEKTENFWDSTYDEGYRSPHMICHLGYGNTLNLTTKEWNRD